MTQHPTRPHSKAAAGLLMAPAATAIPAPAQLPPPDRALPCPSNAAGTAIPLEVEPKAPTVEEPPSPALETPSTPARIPLSAWQGCGEAVIGLAHRRNGLPCQDAVAWSNTKRPVLALSDGAGSAAVSEKGAAALVCGVSRLLVSMEDIVSPWLDDAVGNAQEQAELWSRRLLIHARGLLDDLARAERRKVSDIRATLLLAVVGKAYSFWWQVGDGAIVAQSSSGLRTLGDAEKTKGEFANQTCFVDTAKPADVQFGLVATSEIFGLALMSDGGAEKLVAHDGSRVAPRLGKWLDETAQTSLSPDKIAVAFHEPTMWERTNLDDRSIVITARTMAPSSTQPAPAASDHA